MSCTVFAQNYYSYHVSLTLLYVQCTWIFAATHFGPDTESLSSECLDLPDSELLTILSLVHF